MLVESVWSKRWCWRINKLVLKKQGQ